MPTPRLPRTRFALPALAAAAALAATTAGCGNTSHAKSPPASTTATAAATAAPTAGPVAVTLGEWSVTPSAATVKAGAVSFDVKNGGKMPHEMVVLKATRAAAQLAAAGTPRLKETGHMGEVATLKPGAAGKTTIHLAPGHYVLICNLPGHWTAGMHADLTVR
jgi:uncharacterized cupredoxin-like copper-binding protein